MPRTINAVLFDLFETLITESHVQPTRASSLAPALGLERDSYRPEWKARRPRIVVGELSFAEALMEISQALVGRVDRAAVEGVRQQRIREKAAAYASTDNRVTAMIAGLSRRGITLGVVSNGFKEDVLPWADCSFASAFKCAVFSCNEGVAKPDPEIYRRALQRIEVAPGATVYIGDGADDELAGAERAGLRAYRAAWFAPSPSRMATWPELAGADDVLKLAAAG